jgi:hypothetical protein
MLYGVRTLWARSDHSSLRWGKPITWRRGAGRGVQKVIRKSEMLTTQQYLELIQDRGRKRLELERVYRNLQREELFLLAYGRLYANAGAMTPGTDPTDTVDGMSLERIRQIGGNRHDASTSPRPTASLDP